MPLRSLSPAFSSHRAPDSPALLNKTTRPDDQASEKPFDRRLLHAAIHSRRRPPTHPRSRSAGKINGGSWPTTNHAGRSKTAWCGDARSWTVGADGPGTAQGARAPL